jgi:multidrug efflux pump subunit AcrA (membrane-fusion protein)
MVPWLAFLWTPAFVLASLAGIVFALLLFIGNFRDYVGFIPHILRWETLVLCWITIVVVTLGHEFAHGLTCKRFGGEVHEIGFLMILLMPCFYCNVSDAWLIRQKSRRLWVTLAGGYHDLCVWALAVLAWRLTMQDTLAHHAAWVVMAVCGMRIFLNFNPLLKLDGYYLLSDWLEMPNLRQRALDRAGASLRWLLWGGERPARAQRGTFLLFFGLTSWLFSVTYVTLMLVGLCHILGHRWGPPGVAAAVALGWLLLPRMFRGLTGGELEEMLRMRRRRTAVWCGLLLGAPAMLYFGEMEDRASGQFRIRPAVRAEVRAPVSGFLRVVHAEEGQRVSPHGPIAVMEIPDLTSKLAQKRAELAEVKAKLRLLEVGTRPEEVAEQKQRVDRARHWRDLAEEDLRRKRKGHEEELARLEKQAGQFRAELAHARQSVAQAARLLQRKALAAEQYREAEKQVQVLQAQLDAVLAQKGERVAVGTLEAEGEMAKRQKDLADAQATLNILEAGTRPEEIEAERMKLERLQEERRYLETQQAKLRVVSPVGGLVTTPHLNEKVGQFFKEGELICEVEEPVVLEAEIQLEEQDVARVEPGQKVELKARALLFDTFEAKVERIAPIAVKGEKTDVQSTVTVTCRLADAAGALRPGMTGHARIFCGRRPVGEVLGRNILRFLRTEFWW